MRLFARKDASASLKLIPKRLKYNVLYSAMASGGNIREARSLLSPSERHEQIGQANNGLTRVVAFTI